MQTLRPMPRVLHLISSDRWTGAAEPATNLALSQLRAGYQVWMGCCADSSVEKEVKKRGVPLFQCANFIRSYDLRKGFSAAQDVRRFIAEHQVDVVHCHLPVAHWIAALAAGKNPSTLLVRTIHRDKAPEKNLPHRWLYGRKTDGAILATDAKTRLLAERFADSKLLVQTVRGSVDINVYSPKNDGQGFRRDLNLPDNAILGGIVARITEGRGHRWLFEAIPEAMKANPNLYIAIIGQGGLKKKLRRIALPPTCRDRVIFAGYHKTDLPQVYAGLDFHILLQPGSDATCRAALEAMATGKANVVSDKPALAEIVHDSVNGMVVAENDVEGLAEALAKISTDTDLRQRMGAKARSMAEDQFTFDSLFRSVADVYALAWMKRFGQERDFSAQQLSGTR